MFSFHVLSWKRFLHIYRGLKAWLYATVLKKKKKIRLKKKTNLKPTWKWHGFKWTSHPSANVLTAKVWFWKTADQSWNGATILGLEGCMWIIMLFRRCFNCYLWNVDAVVSHLLEPKSKRELAFDIPVVGEKVMGEEKPDSGSARKKKNILTQSAIDFSVHVVLILSPHILPHSTRTFSRKVTDLWLKTKPSLWPTTSNWAGLAQKTGAFLLEKRSLVKKICGFPFFFFFNHPKPIIWLNRVRI